MNTIANLNIRCIAFWGTQKGVIITMSAEQLNPCSFFKTREQILDLTLSYDGRHKQVDVSTISGW